MATITISFQGGVCSVNGDLPRVYPALPVHRCMCIIVYEQGGRVVGLGFGCREVEGPGGGWLKGFIGCLPRRTAAAFGDPPAVSISEDITCQQLPAEG